MVMSRCQMAVQLLALAVSVLLIGESQAATTHVPCPPDSSSGCRSPCYSSCDALHLTACHEGCTPGCTCNEGFVFQSADSQVCVPVTSCTVTCHENSHFAPCYRQPLETCATLGIQYQPSRRCMPRCVCNEGYVLSNDPEPRCINKKKCRL
ncbi:alpha-tectorin-like [Mantella aurantiaca]